MSLQTKFAVLLALLGLAVVGSLAASVWSFEQFSSGVTRPFTGTATVMQSLAKIKRGMEEQNSIVRGEPRMLPEEEGTPGPAAAATGANLHAIQASVAEELAAVTGNELYENRAGKSTTRNLHARVQEAHALALAWLDSPTDDAAIRAAEAFFGVHELIERIEGNILAASPIQIELERRLRFRLLLVLLLALLTAALTGSLGLILIRRWVIRPVAGLRVAAGRIAQGDLDHRLPVQGNDELALLSGEVNHMAGMVRAMQEERVERERLAAIGEMVRRLAHNLRNPLAGIRGLAEVTRMDLPAGSDLRENQERIITAVDRFERWLKELLGATSPLSVYPEPTPIRAWLEGVVDAHRPMADLKGISVTLDQARGPQEAVFDPRHLEQALVALVTNAIDASPSGGEVQIRTQPSPEGSEWEVTVADQGPGVPAELTEKIFKPYFTTKRDGNGIGLAVAQQVVKAHGGRILVEPGLGAKGGAGSGPGALFRVRMPIRSGAPNGQEARRPAGASGGRSTRHWS
jgi:signal transduction histidine kinase